MRDDTEDARRREAGLAGTAPGSQPEPEHDPRPDEVEAAPGEEREHPNRPARA
jgi:hypothetical protein